MAVQSSSRKWTFVGVGVVAAIALVIGFQNYPRQPKDAAGAIGAAQRHHEPQIAGDDVKVSKDELTTWIQSETFDRIVKDPQARKLFANAAVQDRFAAAGRAALAIEDANNKSTVALAPGEMDQIRQRYMEMTAKDQATALIENNEALRAAFNNNQFCQALLNDAVRLGLEKEALRAADTSGGDPK
jgi:hypothetical protein